MSVWFLSSRLFLDFIMSANNGKNDFALVRKPSSAVEKAAPGTKRIVSGMVADTLALGIKKRTPRIIVVDDEPSFLDLLEGVIRDCFKDAIVLKFDKGEQAWLELLRMPPDFLITDLEMIPLLAERKVKWPIMLLTGSTKGQELHQKVTLALNGKDDILLGKIHSGEFKDEDLQDQTPSGRVQNLLRRVSPALNITFLAKPFAVENFIKIFETGLKIHRRL
jgi:CheY-like chemotaxis protein